MKILPWVIATGILCVVAIDWGKGARNDAEAKNLSMLQTQYPKAARVVRAKDTNHYFIIDSSFKVKELVVEDDGNIREEINSEFK